MFGLSLVFLGGFAIIQVIVLLFDPKPTLPLHFFFTGYSRQCFPLGGLAIVLGPA